MHRRVLVHVGLTKTATTTLQRHVWPAHSGVRYLGKPYADPGAASLGMAVRYLDDIEFAKREAGIKAWWDAQPEESDKVFVVSDEAFSTDRLADRTSMAGRLKRVFGDPNILLVIRSQTDIPTSMYAEYMKWAPGRQPACSFAEWLETAYHLYHVHDPAVRGAYTRHLHVNVVNPLARLDYFSLVRMYHEIFGAERVRMLAYEDLRTDPDGFMDAVCDFAGIDAAEGRRLLAGAGRENPKLDAVSYGLRRHGLYEALRAVSPEPVRALYRALKPSRSHSVAWPANWQERIADLYREGNRELAALLDLDLAARGYPV